MSDEQQSAQVGDADDTVVTEIPTAEAPTADGPAAEVPTADQPTAEEPTVDGPTAEVPTAPRAGRPRASAGSGGGSGLGRSASGPAKSGSGKGKPKAGTSPKTKGGSKPKSKAGSEPAETAGPLLSGYGVASTALAVLAVAAIVFGAITWSAHRTELNERSYRSRVLQTAAGWTHLLINLNAANVEKGMERLRDRSVGQLNSEFDSSIEPFRKVVQQIQSKSVGKIESVVIEATPDVPEEGQADRTPSNLGRTDPVLVVATSIAENVGGKPQIVHWTLHLDVTDVDGQLLISQLWPVR